jgi:ATP-dependent RNA helicase DeaD
MPEEIKLLAREYMNHPESINVSTDAVPIDKIQQSYITVNRKEKFSELLKILEKENPKLCIIFVKTKFGADRLGHMLQRNGKNNITLHGDLSQSKREKALSMFKNKHIHILVATDIAARGIDVSGITHVINYDIPMDPNNYAHRIGRTARAGSEGKAITLVSPEELYEFKMMQRKIGIFINEEKEGVIINNPETDDYSLEDRLTGFEQQHKTSKSSFKTHSNQRFKKHNWHKPINNYRHKK